MKQIRGYETKEYSYESRTERNYHVAEMEAEGWEEAGQSKKLKDGVSLFDAKSEDYEWYAKFGRYTL